MRRAFLALALFSLAVPAFAQSQPLQIQIDSKILNEKRAALIRLPSSYRTGARAYPVVYMTDGPDKFEHTAATIDFLARHGRIPELILVGIANTDRTRDLTPTNVTNQTFEGETFSAPTSGGSAKFLSFIENELIPAVEKSYRTQPYRVFAGHSFGGLFALYSFMERPQLFNAWISVSPSMTWDRNYINRKAPEFVTRTREAKAKIFITSGDEGATLDQEIETFRMLIRSRGPKGTEITTYKFPDEDHGSVVMPSHYAGLKRIFEGWRFPIERRDDARKLHERAREHFAKLSKQVGYKIEIPEPTLNLIGYLLLMVDRKAEAIEAFKENAAVYPQSANVYDSLGEAYEKTGNLPLAKENYERAATLGRQTSDPNLAIFEANRDRAAAAIAKGNG